MSENSEHQTNYVMIFGLLMLAFIGSLGLGYLDSSPLIIVLIFLIAALKAYVVLAYFVHLKAEPRFVKVLVVGVLTIVVILYVGLVPDIVWAPAAVEAAP